MVQVSPPLLVRRMVPSNPTATAVCESMGATACSGAPAGRGFCQNQPDGSPLGAPARELFCWSASMSVIDGCDLPPHAIVKIKELGDNRANNRSGFAQTLSA